MQTHVESFIRSVVVNAIMWSLILWSFFEFILWLFLGGVRTLRYGWIILSAELKFPNLSEDEILNIVKNDLNRNSYFTCSQHIHFRKLIPLFKALKIKILYSAHKKKGENNIDGIMILPCPLYAVNLEDESRNEIFKGKDYMNINIIAWCSKKQLYNILK